MTPTMLKNRYRVIRKLADGGFGETFLAEDTDTPSSRRCVIKQLKPVANNPQVYQLVQERFQREAAILEELGDGSNQIPTLYAYFVEVGQFYLVQEWIQGQTLTNKLEQAGLLSESSVNEILIGILPVLEYVHSKRIVHRDIKPENIILRLSNGKPVLIDFGAVKETMGTLVTASGKSSQSIVIGTPGFMPSEQSAGRPVFSSDLYSLGLTAIYLLTGKMPQELETEPQTGEILWRQHALNVSPSLAAVLDKSIQSYARDRYSTAREMLEALHGATSISPTIPVFNPTVVSAPPPGVSYQPHASSQAVIIGGVIGACVVGGLWLTSQQTTEPEREPIVGQNTSPATSPNSQPVVPPQPPSDSASLPSASPRQEAASPQPIAPAIPAQSTVTPQISLTQPQQPNQPRSLGWLRIGAVNNTLGTASVREPLIKTSQPVTISPPVVPSISDEVTIINGVNLRKTRPQKPYYKLAEQIGMLVPGQKIVILKLDIFTDPNSPAPYTVVWAEVGLLN